MGDTRSMCQRKRSSFILVAMAIAIKKGRIVSAINILFILRSWQLVHVTDIVVYIPQYFGSGICTIDFIYPISHMLGAKNWQTETK